MGAWIRGFIEALGIITPGPAQQSSNEIFPSPVGVPCRRDAPNSETAEYAVPERVDPNVLGGGPSASLDSETDIVVLDNLNDLSADLDSIQLYDEVYPMQYGRRSTKNLNASPHKRRWSSPFVHSAPISRSNDCLEQNTGFIVGNHSNRWCVPPPSRRLLAQPLPPLPSVGPSGAESMAGTIASSHTSSNLTADESVLQQEEAASEPEISIPTWSSTRAKCHVPLRKRRTSCCSRSPRLSPDTNHQVLPNLPRRHSSLISLYYQLPYNEPMVDVASGIPDPIGPLPASRDDLDEVDTVNMSTTTHNHHALGLDFASSSQSYDTSTTCAGFPSDLSLPCTEDIYSTDWRLRPLPSWPEDSPCAKPVNVALAAAAARRSVSCITGTKPRIASLEDPRIISTLPPRHELDSAFSNHLVDPVAHLLPGMVPIRPRINLFHRTAQSSHSSQTTTSSGAVAMACPSSSPRSEGTTRPASSTISWPPPAPEVEESEGYHVDWYLKPHPESNEATSPPDASESLAVARQPSNPISVNGRQCETVTDGVTHSGGDDYSPMNTSLILVATQLEEVQHGAQKLRSRRETLSFRLSNRLTKERSDKSETSPRPVSTEKTVVGDDASHAGICSQRDTAREDDGTEEATASLYARLAAIEMLISQAASMEARLRDEMIRYLPNGSSAPDPAFSTGLQLL
ncbi:unnamed protein product [Dicrocoelium dendriticum]|nr:unnamed protein product [Dicrocoelium dendriticum]